MDKAGCQWPILLRKLSQVQLNRHWLFNGGIVHDDIIKRDHFHRSPDRSPVNSTHKGKWRGCLMFSFVCTWINGWVNDRGAGDLRRYHAHYDVIVMLTQINLLSKIDREIITDVESLKTKFNIWTHLASIKIKYPVYCYRLFKTTSLLTGIGLTYVTLPQLQLLVMMTSSNENIFRLLALCAVNSPGTGVNCGTGSEFILQSLILLMIRSMKIRISHYMNTRTLIKHSWEMQYI